MGAVSHVTTQLEVVHKDTLFRLMLFMLTWFYVILNKRPGIPLKISAVTIYCIFSHRVFTYEYKGIFPWVCVCVCTRCIAYSPSPGLRMHNTNHVIRRS